MKKFLFILFLSAILVSCSSEKEDLYDQAIEEIKTKLKHPDTAEFEDFDENNVYIQFEAGEANPIKAMNLGNYDKMLERATGDSKKRLLEQFKYDLATVIGEYKSKNDFGMFREGKFSVIFYKFENASCGGKECAWFIVFSNIE
jgi:superfamily I DNA and/or RNA helicase